MSFTEKEVTNVELNVSLQILQHKSPLSSTQWDTLGSRQALTDGFLLGGIYHF